MAKMKVPKTGMDIDVCNSVKCKFFQDVTCVLCNCESYKSRHGCPLPKECSYKNIHMLSGIRIKVCEYIYECPLVTIKYEYKDEE